MKLRLRIQLLSAMVLLFFGIALTIDSREAHKSTEYADSATKAQLFVQSEISSIDSTISQITPLLKAFWLNDRAISSHLNINSSSSFYIYQQSKIKFWTDNKVFLDSTQVKQIKNKELNFLGNGWYYVSKIDVGERTLIGLFPIYYQFGIQNSFLKNGFVPSMKIPENSELLVKATSGSWAVTDASNKYLFSILFNKIIVDKTANTVVNSFLAVAMFCLFLLLLNLAISWGRRGSIRGLFLIAGVLMLRFFMLNYQWPKVIYQANIFSPIYYASSYFLNSLGDLLITVSIFLIMISYGYSCLNKFEKDNVYKEGRKTYHVLIILFFLFAFLFAVIINYLVSGLIIDSQISFNISNVYELTSYSIAGLLAIALLLITLYLICDGGIRYIIYTGFNKLIVLILFLISQGIFLLLLLKFRNTELFKDFGVSAFLLANLLILLLGYVRGTVGRSFSFARTLLVIMGFSIYAAQVICTFNTQKEEEKRKLIAERLENEQDVVAEYLLEDIEDKLSNESLLKDFFKFPINAISSNSSQIDEIDRRIIRKYFTGYMSRYDVSFKLFTVDDIPINKVGDPSWDMEKYHERISNLSRPTYAKRFHFIPEPSGLITYLGKIEVVKEGKLLGYILVELNSRFTNEEGGLPDLLLSDKVRPKRDISNYSYAKYQNGKLVSQSGNFTYYLTPTPYEEYYRNLTRMKFVEFDGFSHLIYKNATNGLIIVSTTKQSVLIIFTLFSYIFTFFSLGYLIIYLIIRWVRNGFKLEINFKSRIQLAIMSIVVGSMVLIGFFTLTSIVKNYEQAQSQRIKEKLENVIVLVQNELNSRNFDQGVLGDDLSYSFTQLSSTLNIDFNIYSSEGLLLFSSQPKIYDQALIGRLINREAFNKLILSQKAMYIQSENIGLLKYSSAYEPIRNNRNQIIGYLSLPYFARETELKKEISSFLVTLINIYMLLFCLAIGIAFFISSRITKPLIVIQDSLRKTKLGRKSEPIIWKQKDEIGALINEYNRMLNEIQLSAEILAKSERESAWREMAKQVAHEIKNPLTPMKLGVQHLQRAWNNNHPDKDNIIDRISQSLIEQIDTLSNIANEFSNFAKLPKADLQHVDLAHIISSVVDLYVETEEVDFQFDRTNSNLMVLGDNDQLIRVFSNLIKNAIQAIPEGRSGIVSIDIHEEDKQYVVNVKDNGKGISADEINKIFVPNFTTKSSGMGLGLAMVKNMIDGMNGSISFESTVDIGTTFTIKLTKLL